MSIAEAIIERLGQERRRVLSDWRALVLLRRATIEIPAGARRWRKFPEMQSDIFPALRGMKEVGLIAAIPGLWRVYRVSTPYADLTPVDELEMLFEANPWMCLADLSAFQFHGLTWTQPRSITVVDGRAFRTATFPLGTRSDDWEGLDLPERRTPKKIMSRTVERRTERADRLFGLTEVHHQGVAIRVFTVERCLVDGLFRPERCGGISTVINAWLNNAHLADVDTLVSFIELYGVAVLRQRVGFLAERAGLHHSAFDRWQRTAARGGSSKLVAKEPYGDTYDARWNLALNASSLNDLDARS